MKTINQELFSSPNNLKGAGNSKRIRSLFFFILSFVIMSSLLIGEVSAEPPQSQTTPDSINIEYLKIFYHKQGENFSFHFHVSNSTQVLGNESVDCDFDLFDQNGNNLVDRNNLDHENKNEFFIDVRGGNFSSLGEYSTIIECNSSSQAGFSSFGFYVTPNGEEATVGRAVFYIGLLFLLTVFLIISIYGFVVSDQIWQRAGGISAMYLFLIAISFISWNMAEDFLTSSPFLIEFLNIIFLVLMIAFFPFLLGLFAYGVYLMLMNKEIIKMMEKGMSFDEAVSRKKSRRKKRW